MGFRNMKTNLSMLCLIAFGFFLLELQAVVLPDSVSIASGTSVDEYIAESNIQTIDLESAGDQARASRDEYFAKKANSTLDWNMPSSLDGSGSTPSQSRSQAQEQIQSEVQDAAASITANASGTWSLKLTDSIQRDVSLALFQDGSTIFGSGSIREGNSTRQLMASGSLQGAALSLDLTAQQPMMLYKLILNLSQDEASGRYSAKPASGGSWTGEVDGFRLTA